MSKSPDDLCTFLSRLRVQPHNAQKLDNQRSFNLLNGNRVLLSGGGLLNCPSLSPSRPPLYSEFSLSLSAPVSDPVFFLRERERERERELERVRERASERDRERERERVRGRERRLKFKLEGLTVIPWSHRFNNLWLIGLSCDVILIVWVSLKQSSRT